jgi:hypothetical protein
MDTSIKELTNETHIKLQNEIKIEKWKFDIARINKFN